jgi:hypothetical protein
MTSKREQNAEKKKAQVGHQRPLTTRNNKNNPQGATPQGTKDRTSTSSKDSSRNLKAQGSRPKDQERWNPRSKTLETKSVATATAQDKLETTRCNSPKWCGRPPSRANSADSDGNGMKHGRRTTPAARKRKLPSKGHQGETPTQHSTAPIAENPAAARDTVGRGTRTPRTGTTQEESARSTQPTRDTWKPTTNGHKNMPGNKCSRASQWN